jgi:hypothetical protein
VKLETRIRNIRIEVKKEEPMKKEEVVMRLNRMMVDYMRRASLEYNLTYGLNSREHEVMADELKKNAIALNTAAKIIALQ